MTAHDEFVELIVGHALDALEPADEHTLLAHLPTCEACRAVLDEMRQVAATLAYGVDEEEPPAQLRESIRAAVAASAVDPTPLLVEPVSMVGRTRRSGQRDRVLVSGPRSTRSTRGTRIAMRLGSIAAAAALLLGGGYLLGHHSSGSGHSAATTAESSLLAHMQDSGAYQVTLTSGGAATGAAVVDGRSVYLVTANLGANDAANSEYVLWAAAPSGHMIAVKGFNITSNGSTVVQATLPAGISSPQTFGVTHEAGHTLPASPGLVVLGSDSA